MVRDELGIPEQTRYLVPIDLGRVEKHVRVSLPLLPTYFLMAERFSSTTRTWSKLSSLLVSMLEA